VIAFLVLTRFNAAFQTDFTKGNPIIICIDECASFIGSDSILKRSWGPVEGWALWVICAASGIFQFIMIVIGKVF
jgi:hypothetical protein